MRLAPSQPFQSVQEWDNSFLALWTHRYDYLWAEHPDPAARPEWKTESRFPLSDRLIKQGAYLYGVRFGPTTRYILLDLDKGSLYHPVRDRFAWHRIVAVLESIGLTQPVICTSSYSSGLHLYFPFENQQKTWAIALAVKTLLENAGFKLAPGQLEVFPNCKPYATDGNFGLHNGHRLPMQAGSYLLNPDLQMIWGDQQTFVQHWQLAQSRNSIDEKAVDLILKAARCRQYRITHKADKFLNDLNAEIEQGWTGPGQTNRLLGRIAMRSYIFGHVYDVDTPLEGQALIDHMINTARNLPGYEDWCGHQHEIEQRAEDWAHCVESSRYFPYGIGKNKTQLLEEQQSTPTWHEQKQEDARERIRKEIAQLLETNTLPIKPTARFNALVAKGIGGGTLYKHKDLWHPEHLMPVENPPHPQGLASERTLCAPECANLLSNKSSNNPSDKDLKPLEPDTIQEISSNTHSEREGLEWAKQRVAEIKALQDYKRAAQKQAWEQLQLIQMPAAPSPAHIARMQQWLESGDPILVAEAEVFFSNLHKN